MKLRAKAGGVTAYADENKNEQRKITSKFSFTSAWQKITFFAKIARLLTKSIKMQKLVN